MDSVRMDLTGRLMADMDPSLLEFLQSTIDSFVKWDLIRFFHDNPYTTDTADNIARYTGRNIEAIQNDLAELAQSDVLDEDQLGDLTVYSLTRDAETRQMLAKFATASNDRQFRVKAIYHIIRGAH